MKLAFVDLVFSWPPLGGAPLDLYQTMVGLQQLGHNVKLFFAADKDNWNRGEMPPGSLPFDSQRLDFGLDTFTPEHLPARFREAVDGWRPDVVFVCFGFFMKPFVTKALAGYPLVSRYYAYEVACLRDYRQFWKKATCPNDYLNTPNACRRCTARALSKDIRTARINSYAREYLAAGAHRPEYYDTLVESVRSYDAIIVYNHMTKRRLSGLNSNIHVIPGGVHTGEFAFTPPPQRKPGEKKVILMTGRAVDYSKGLHIIKRCGALLAQRRDDFEFWVTVEAPFVRQVPWIRPLGWHDVSELPAFYRQADICVVPSVWEEPFGMVAVEAMATGRPVCVSRVGGLQEIITPGETGFIYDRNDHSALAGHLETLLDQPDLRARMGEAGRRRVEQEYDWLRIMEKYYPPMLESLVKKAKTA